MKNWTSCFNITQWITSFYFENSLKWSHFIRQITGTIFSNQIWQKSLIAFFLSQIKILKSSFQKFNNLYIRTFNNLYSKWLSKIVGFRSLIMACDSNWAIWNVPEKNVGTKWGCIGRNWFSVYWSKDGADEESRKILVFILRAKTVCNIESLLRGRGRRGGGEKIGDKHFITLRRGYNSRRVMWITQPSGSSAHPVLFLSTL